MKLPVTVDFAAFTDIAAAGPASGSGDKDPISMLIVLAGEDLQLGDHTQSLLAPVSQSLQKAARASKFKGKRGSSFEILAPAGLGWDRLVVVGCAAKSDDAGAAVQPEGDASLTLGGAIMGRIGEGVSATILLDAPASAGHHVEASADIVLGAALRSYKFDRYRTKKTDESEPSGPASLTFAVADPAKTREKFAEATTLAEGVLIARDLVNEPPNILFPEEFAKRASELEKLGVTVEILDKAALTRLGMGALLAVGQGSARESRVVIMRWNGGAEGEQPVAFVGKGVCFDSGGISIKPAASMEDMKGDMAGAACVVGLMHALAGRKAAVNVIGAIGLVENMPDGAAYRPSDILRSLSGQTIEVINTDAEGRLVLADVLWYVQDTYKPRFIVDLATLTGAILVALGTQYAGLFSNNDELAANLTQAGLASGEVVWRMPMSAAFDKMIDSKFADMKNTGGRYGGSITAAQFLQRHVNKTPWAHLDIAGVGMGAPSSDINHSWGAGWGVRLLDRLVRDYYETKKDA